MEIGNTVVVIVGPDRLIGSQGTVVRIFHDCVYGDMIVVHFSNGFECVFSPGQLSICYSEQVSFVSK